jgi:hypothetical protein
VKTDKNFLWFKTIILALFIVLFGYTASYSFSAAPSENDGLGYEPDEEFSLFIKEMKKAHIVIILSVLTSFGKLISIGSYNNLNKL